MKAWINQASFTQGTSMSAWLFTILRNVFYSEYRKRRREVEDAEGTMAARLVSVPEQNGHMDLQDLRTALAKLPAEQREALILVGGSGFAYEEAAQICGCALGTLKSRVNRARTAIANPHGHRVDRRCGTPRVARDGRPGFHHDCGNAIDGLNLCFSTGKELAQPGYSASLNAGE